MEEQEEKFEKGKAFWDAQEAEAPDDGEYLESVPLGSIPFGSPLTGFGLCNFLRDGFGIVLQSPLMETISEQVFREHKAASLQRLRSSGLYAEDVPDVEVGKGLDDALFYRQFRFLLAEAVRGFLLSFAFSTDALLFELAETAEEDGLSHRRMVAAFYKGMKSAAFQVPDPRREGGTCEEPAGGYNDFPLEEETPAERAARLADELTGSAEAEREFSQDELNGMSRRNHDEGVPDPSL